MANRKVPRIPRNCEQCNKYFEAHVCEVRRGGGRFCSPSCWYTWNTTPVADRFRSHLSEPNELGCVEWTGGTAGFGYGRFRATHDAQQVQAHRYAYELAGHIIPEGLFVLHNCDNPACVNPEHLFVGTQTDNMRDMASKGRQWKMARRLAREAAARQEAEGDADGLALGEALGLADGEAEGLALSEAEGVTDGEADMLRDGDALGLLEGL